MGGPVLIASRKSCEYLHMEAVMECCGVRYARGSSV